jgi:hypothetical protein
MQTIRLIIQNQHVLFLLKERNGGARCRNGMPLHRCSTAVGQPTKLALIIEACCQQKCVKNKREKIQKQFPVVLSYAPAILLPKTR